MKYKIVILDASMPGGLRTYAQNLNCLSSYICIDYLTVFGGNNENSIGGYRYIFAESISGSSLFIRVLKYLLATLLLPYKLLFTHTIFVASTPAILALPIIMINRIFGFKVIWTVHLPLDNEGAIKRLGIKAAAIMGVSFVVLNKTAATQYRKFSAKVYVIPNYSRFKPVTKLSVPKNKFSLLTIGRFTHQKGYPENINLLINLSKLSNVESVTIIGEGPFYELLVERVGSASVDNIKIVKAPCDPVPYFTDNDIFLLPSRFEGLPMVLLEALSFDLVPIAYDCLTGPREILNNEKLLVDVMDAAAFLKIVQNLEPRDIDDLRLELRERRRYFSQEYFVTRWRDILNEK